MTSTKPPVADNDNHHDFYVYAWLRPSGEPFYIGKGRKRRYAVEDRQNPLFKRIVAKVRKDGNEPIVVRWHEGLKEVDAFQLERQYIKLFGRRDIGTGVLSNLTDGGDGCSGIGEPTLLKFADTCLSKPPRSGKYKGVLRYSRNWLAVIRHHGSITYIGTYKAARDAARAYDEAAARISDIAYLNFPAFLGGDLIAPLGKRGAIVDRTINEPPPPGKFKGVTAHGKKYRARITLDGRRVTLGNFRTPEDAARAYDSAALKQHGHGKCYLNFTEEHDGSRTRPDVGGGGESLPVDN